MNVFRPDKYFNPLDKISIFKGSYPKSLLDRLREKCWTEGDKTFIPSDINFIMFILLPILFEVKSRSIC